MVRSLNRAAIGLLFAAAAAGAAHAQSPPMSPDDFVAAAGGADQYEIMAGRTALTASRDPGVRAFAQEMVRDHAAAFAALGQAAARSGLKPPSTSVGADQAALLATLQNLRGSEFDRAYARQQDLAHRATLVTEERYARDGSDPNLKAAAAADLPMVRHHLAAAGSL